MDTTLPAAAVPAWDAYLAMDVSKQRHYQFLQVLEKKVDEGGYRTAGEATQLASLLNTHDVNVRDFKRQIQDLARQDLAAHQSLLEHITLLNTPLDAGNGG
jgi:hypothetical protein